MVNHAIRMLGGLRPAGSYTTENAAQQHGSEEQRPADEVRSYTGQQFLQLAQTGEGITTQHDRATANKGDEACTQTLQTPP